jgi:hypothetical protein
LSITNLYENSFTVENGDMIHPSIEEARKYSKETNICQLHGRCGLGCIADARHSLDKKIYESICSGKPIDILPLCEVSNIEENPFDFEYKYTINFEDRREHENERSKKMHAKHVILAAGALGSTEILLRSTKLKLSKKLGTSFSTNGDIFGIISPTKEAVDPTRGPTITSIAKFVDKATANFPKFFPSKILEYLGCLQRYLQLYQIL